MGVSAIDEIVRPLKNAARELEAGQVSANIIHVKNGSVSSLVYTIRKSVADLEYLSENLKSRGFRDSSLLGRLKQAFAGLFGGF